MPSACLPAHRTKDQEPTCTIGQASRLPNHASSVHGTPTRATPPHPTLPAHPAPPPTASAPRGCAQSRLRYSGQTTLAGEGSVEPENPIWVEFAHSMAPMMAPMAAPLGAIVMNGLSGPIDILDIAAGHGLFGIEAARQNPQARITAVDWVHVLEVAKANAAKAGVQDRYRTLPGSAFEVDYGGPHDVVLLTNFPHHLDRAACVTLLGKVYAALKPGGIAAALEFVPNEDRVPPPMAAAFSLTMLASTVAGDSYTFREYESMYREAGFTNISAHPIPMAPHTIVMGER